MRILFIQNGPGVTLPGYRRRRGSWDLLRAGRPGLDGADEDALATDLVSGGLEADDAVAAVLRQVQGAGPGVHGAEPVAPADQVLNVDEAPHQVGGHASEPQAHGLGDGRPVSMVAIDPLSKYW